MRRILLILAAVLVLSVLVLPAEPWKWRTHGGVFGSRGISTVAYNELGGGEGLSANLDWDLIMEGSHMPDTWNQPPYYADSSHKMTYTKERGAYWLRRVENAAVTAQTDPGAWDNVSFFMGIASHYWADTTCYPHHDNARLYYENKYGEDYGYTLWDAVHDHFEGQVYYYQPEIPKLIVPDSGCYDLDTFLAAADDFFDNWIDNVMPPGNPMGGWLGQWIQTRKCEDAGIQAGLLPHSGTKECVDLATTLIYSGWVYALGYQVATPTVTWGDLTRQYF